MNLWTGGSLLHTTRAVVKLKPEKKKIRPERDFTTAVVVCITAMIHRKFICHFMATRFAKKLQITL